MRLSKKARTRWVVARALLLWFWYWIPVVLAYMLLRILSAVGDWAYEASERINGLDPEWMGSVNRRVLEINKEEEQS